MLEMTKVIPQIVRRFDINVDVKTLPWSLSTYWFVKQHYNSTIQLRSEEKNQGTTVHRQYIGVLQIE